MKILPSANVNDFERTASVLAGTALMIGAMRANEGRTAKAITAAGLLARGLSGYCPVNSVLGRERRRDDTRQALGGDRGVRIEETVTIRRAPSDLYTFWRQLKNLPQVFSHLSSVETTGPRTSHWVMEGPAGTKFEWDAEIINDVKPELIAWRSLPGADIASAGSVAFKESVRNGREATDVTVVMQYDAPGGIAARALAWLAGMGPEKVVREELLRFKESFEFGEPSIQFRSQGAFDASSLV
ncbi:MAG TPA: SRPBCC family protein [Vicinamibacterales bacterium]|nr:SRPBCC family protein [Vicinamibacterales bacterium]